MISERARPDAPSNNAAAEKVLRSFNTWAFKREQPENPELMLRFIADAMSLRGPVKFVLYWGKGPRCELAEPDTQCLNYLTGLARRVRESYEPGAETTLIFTDTHAKLNGQRRACVERYFGSVDIEARRSGFRSVWLSELLGADQSGAASEETSDAISHDTLQALAKSAVKWFRGEGTPEEGALKYFRMNMVERRAVERSFASSIFVTFNGSELRSLFPTQLPIFYMYSLRRGVSVKPWFLQSGANSCIAICEGGVGQTALL